LYHVGGTAREKGSEFSFLLIITYNSLCAQYSLLATIQQERPDILPNVKASAAPIPLDIPPHFLDRLKKPHIVDVGEPMTACFLTGVQTDPTGW